jgi:hypothetical protein
LLDHADVLLHFNTVEALRQNGSSGGINLAQERNLVSSLGQTDLEAANSRKQPNCSQ